MSEPRAETLRAALLLAHDSHEFGPEHCNPANCSAEAAIQTFADRVEHKGRAWHEPRAALQGDADAPVGPERSHDHDGCADRLAALTCHPGDEFYWHGHWQDRARGADAPVGGLREALEAAGRYIASLGGDESAIVAARIEQALAAATSSADAGAGGLPR